MQFTLDSIEHAKACLEEHHKGAKVVYRPLYTTSKEDFIVKEGRYLFGVFYLSGYKLGSSNVYEDVLLMGYHNDDLLENFRYSFEVPVGTQLVALSRGLYMNKQDADDKESYPIFRGFEITINL